MAYIRHAISSLKHKKLSLNNNKMKDIKNRVLKFDYTLINGLCLFKIKDKEVPCLPCISR